MKIAICMSWFGKKPTGIGKSLIYLFDAIAKNFPDVDLIIFYRKSQTNLKLPFHAKKIIFRNNILGRLILRYKLRKCDFIHYHYNGWIVENQNNRKSIFMIHDILPMIIPGYFAENRKLIKYKNIIQNALKKGKIILTPSNYSKQDIMNNFDCPRPIEVIYNGAAISMAQRDKSGEYYIYSGGYDRRKGLVDLLKTFIKSDVKRKLVFVGQQKYFSDEFKSLVDIAKEKGILTEKGYVSDEELSELIANAKAMIYPSKFEGFGMPPLEAMMLGTPALVAPAMSLPEVCGDAALYFDHEKDGDLEQLLRKIESDPELLKDMAKKGYRRAAEFTWDRAAKKYIEILQKHCAKK